MPRVLFALTLALAAASARAALFPDEEARKSIDALTQRINQLDGRVNGLESTVKSQGLVDLLKDIEQIKSDIAALRGQQEVLSYELEQAQKRQRDLYIDLDGRLRKLETSTSAPAAAAPAPDTGATPPASANASLPGTAARASPPAGNTPSLPPTPTWQPGTRVPPSAVDLATEQRAYDAALDQFKSGSYPAAITGFQSFVRSYPRSPLAPSAVYWTGNAQYAQRDFRAAIATQRSLIATYPDSQKVPDALLNIASSQSELGDNAGARRTLEDLVSRYPTSEAAGKARQRMSAR